MENFNEIYTYFEQQVKIAIKSSPELASQSEKNGGIDSYAEILLDLWRRQAFSISKHTGENPADIFQRTIFNSILKNTESVDKSDRGRIFFRDGLERKPDNATAFITKLPDDVQLPKFKRLQDFKKWVCKILDEIECVTIASTNQICRFAHSGVKDSLKRARSENHKNVYAILTKMVENAEYDYSIYSDKRHSTNQDIYRAALRIGKNLFTVKLKLDIVSEHSKQIAKGRGNEIIEDVHYKDHRISEIEIAPTLLYGRLQNGVARQTVDAISKISLGVLRKNVKPSKIAEDTLFQISLDDFSEPLGSITARNGCYFINLFKNANLSTLAHEMGHLFFLEMERAVRQGTADEQLRTDYKTLCNWVGVKNIRKLNAKQHEQLARGWESYLMEGIPPEPSLTGVFTRFCNWLCNIYESAKDYKIKLNDDVRAVFDRMLTDNENDIETDMAKECQNTTLSL